MSAFLNQVHYYQQCQKVTSMILIPSKRSNDTHTWQKHSLHLQKQQIFAPSLPLSILEGADVHSKDIDCYWPLLLLKPKEQSMGLCGSHWHHHCWRRVFLSKRLAQTSPFSFRSCHDPLRVRLGQDFIGTESNNHVRCRSENLLSHHGRQFF